MAGGPFTYRRGGAGYDDFYQGDGWSLGWNGRTWLAICLEGARRGIDECARAGHDMAKYEHTWVNRTGQTEAAVFFKSAEIEIMPRPSAGIGGVHVWGEWGVEDRPRFEVDDDGHLTEDLDDVSTKDVALFLEFGTSGSALRPWDTQAHPWLYPAWDATKIRLPEAVARYTRLVADSGAPQLRDALGRFRTLLPDV